jgi:hypothetical protein
VATVEAGVVEVSAPATDDGPTVSPTPMRIVATAATAPSRRRKVTPSRRRRVIDSRRRLAPFAWAALFVVESGPITIRALGITIVSSVGG